MPDKTVRIFKLAKELGLTSKDLTTYLRTQGHNVKSHMSTVPDSVASILRDRHKPKAKPKAAPAATGASNGGKTAASEAPRRDAPSKKSSGDTAVAVSAKTASQRVSDRAPTTDGGESGDRRKSKGRTGKEPKETRKQVRIFVQDEAEDSGSYFASGRKRPPARRYRRDSSAAVVQRPSNVDIALPVSVKDLSALTTLKVNDIVKVLMGHGQMVNINANLDEEQVTLVCLEHNIETTFKQKEEDVEEFLAELEQTGTEDEQKTTRAPVVTFLGHVDHGKTSLLDKIRESSVTDGEAGGITQHLGAYRVDTDSAHVVFIDTPGHQAFTEMRARGANVTDVAVLIVAADDGVKPQTEEAYNHAKAAEVPIVVALNKIDKESANPMRCKQQLAELGLLPVEWNGDTEVVEVSAQTGQGIDTLLETLSLTAEILELDGHPERSAIGTVLEAAATKSRGVIATVLVQDGTLRRGDHVVCGSSYGRVRGMWVNGTQVVKHVGPSTPVQVTGLNSAPDAGERLYVISEAQKAREIAEVRAERQREKAHAERQKQPVTLDSIFAHLDKKDEPQVLSLIIKGDVRGSIEALTSSIQRLSTDEVEVNVLHSGVGAITQQDVALADASGAIVIGFHVVADERARVLAEERGVDIRVYQIIYEAIDEIKAAMESRLAPEHEEKVKGHAEIRQVYKASKIGNIAGCIVLDGVFTRSDKVRLLRDGRITYTGNLGSLKRFKDDAREVREGFECGIKIAKFDDIKVGDVIEAFTMIEKRRTI